MQSKPKLLYVDLERSHGISFKANFRRSYDVEIASTISEGLDIIKRNSIQVVFADQRLLAQDSLFNDPNALLPILIIVHSGLVIEELHQLPDWKQTFQIVSKPWNEKELEQVLELAVVEYEQREKLLKLGTPPGEILRITSKASTNRINDLLKKVNKKKK